MDGVSHVARTLSQCCLFEFVARLVLTPLSFSTIQFDDGGATVAG
jgi:hypothetical protein